MFVEDLPVQVHADVRLHVFRAVVEHFVGVQALGHRPGAHDVVHHPLAQSLRHLVQLHELPHVVQHVVVLGGGGCHLLDDRGYVTEDRGVEQSWGKKGT